MSRKSVLDGAFLSRPGSRISPALEASNPVSPQLAEVPRSRSGALKAMSNSLARFSAGAGAAVAIEEGSAVVELDTELIDGSFLADRVDDPTDTSLADLTESIRESGQQVPILVRPHPDRSGRYQIAYGHRRARAAGYLGRPVRAVVRSLSDAELVVAQGKENLERRDLSYIERAFFAMRLEGMGFGREVISAAMGVHKPDVSNFITVARAIPETVVAAIGPAPKAGGPRWRKLSKQIKAAAQGKVKAILEQQGFAEKPTDARFITLFDALAEKTSPRSRKPEVIKDLDGRKIARIEESSDHFNLSIDRRLEPEFGFYLRDRLPEILAAFKACKE